MLLFKPLTPTTKTIKSKSKKYEKQEKKNFNFSCTYTVETPYKKLAIQISLLYIWNQIPLGALATTNARNSARGELKG